MVQTRSAAKAVELARTRGDDGKDDAVENSTGKITLPPAKKPRPDPARLKRRRRGKPGQLCQLNLDVLFLIADYIHPLDLLSLARTCKSLRFILMDKSSICVWKHARRQVEGFPDCPADLTEPEYANLAFCARCHECGKYAKIVFWKLRRRYCPKCRVTNLCHYDSCPWIIRSRSVLPLINVMIDDEPGPWVDRKQMDSFMDEHERAPDKPQFLSDKERQLGLIHKHAHDCEDWQKMRETARQYDLERRRQDRIASIFERLKKEGYDQEIVFFGPREIQSNWKSLFRTSRPLKDKEWDQVSPTLFGIMNGYRSRRLEVLVYHPRRVILASAYATYVASPPSNAPTFDLLPHVIDLGRFPPFRTVIRGPEGSPRHSDIFESAFVQLPELIGEWRKRLDVELAGLVEIPPQLSRQGTPGVASTSGTTTDTEPPQLVTDRLHLACALFECGRCGGSYTYPQVFSVALHDFPYPDHDASDGSERTGSLWDRYKIRFMDGAPYIIHACGLDPNVATVEDMDRLDARLECLCCQEPRIMNWRDMVWHIHLKSEIWQATHNGPRCRVIDGEHIQTIRKLEQSIQEHPTFRATRCLFCRPHVGDARRHNKTLFHLESTHNIEAADAKEGVHFSFMGMEVRSTTIVKELKGFKSRQEPRNYLVDFSRS